MFVVLALQLYIYVSFHYRFLTATFNNSMQGKAPVDVYYFIFISIGLYLLKYIYVPTIFQVFPLSCGYSIAPF